MKRTSPKSKVKTQTAKLRPRNWWKRIAAAEKRGSFLDRDIEDSGEWVTCACGAQDPKIPRDLDGSPIDRKLEDLGLQFCDAVADDNPKAATATLKKIEKRATWLMKHPKVLARQAKLAQKAADSAANWLRA